MTKPCFLLFSLIMYHYINSLTGIETIMMQNLFNDNRKAQIECGQKHFLEMIIRGEQKQETIFFHSNMNRVRMNRNNSTKENNMK